jgi:organic hydroperoxide reductase OsmC/OhrA
LRERQRPKQDGGDVNISARVRNSEGEHEAVVTANGVTRSIAIPPKASGVGSSASGGELLFLALATCYCNDIYREAVQQGVRVEQVEVVVAGQFGAAGEPASHVTYRARVVADAPEAEIRALMLRTDALAEIQNTLRVATPVTLDGVEAVKARL